MSNESFPWPLAVILAVILLVVWLRLRVVQARRHLRVLEGIGQPCVHCADRVTYSTEAEAWVHAVSGRLLCASAPDAPHSLARPIRSAIQ